MNYWLTGFGMLAFAWVCCYALKRLVSEKVVDSLYQFVGWVLGAFIFLALMHLFFRKLLLLPAVLLSLLLWHLSRASEDPDKLGQRGLKVACRKFVHRFSLAGLIITAPIYLVFIVYTLL